MFELGQEDNTDLEIINTPTPIRYWDRTKLLITLLSLSPHGIRPLLLVVICIYSSEEFTIPPHIKALVPIDIAVAPPLGTFPRVAPPSGLAVKKSIDIGAGVIDEDYRGQVKIYLIHNLVIPFEVKKGDRVLQLILKCILMIIPEALEAKKQ